MTENEEENNETSLTDKRARGFRKRFKALIFNPVIYYDILPLTQGYTNPVHQAAWVTQF
jgi:hypothetical protein